jgi:hydroxymethylglutaryl-CoA lyase
LPNFRGAEKALEHEKIDYLGFPFSISETFQHRNTNKSREEAFTEVQRIFDLTKSKNKDLILYFSMAFGNPYGEMWKWQDVEEWAQRFSDMGVKTVMLSDTTGVSDAETIALLFSKIPSLFPDIEFGAHFHNRYEDSYKKLKAAYDNGCRRFDTAIKGLEDALWLKMSLSGICLQNSLLISFRSKKLTTGLTC